MLNSRVFSTTIFTQGSTSVWHKLLILVLMITQFCSSFYLVLCHILYINVLKTEKERIKVDAQSILNKMRRLYAVLGCITGFKVLVLRLHNKPP